MKSSPKKSDYTRSPAPKSPGTGLLVLSLIFRLLLLGVGSGFAWALGVGAAQIYPSAATEIPLSEKLLRQFQDLTSGPKPISQAPSPIVPSPIATSSSSQLSLAQRQKLQADLRQLQGELNALIGRTAALETQLGSSRPTETLEKRLELMSQELGTPASAAEPSPALPAVGKDSSPIPGAKPNSGEQSSAGKSSVFSGDVLMVTLPSDVLFDAGSSALRVGTNVILDNLIADLRNYEGATVRIGAHTDDVGEAKDNQNLSFARAQAVTQYLSKTLGDKYHWVAIGYGESRPSVENTTDANRQRNRRIEVAIAPKR
ncbi:MAG TPA: OmpA family protein [Kamptonema sp.]|nr:OmpA family protein [Kamptonema sp.]